jgi:hypothetical protein
MTPISLIEAKIASSELDAGSARALWSSNA